MISRLALLPSLAALVCGAVFSQAAPIVSNLNVEIVQVCNDAGADCTDLGPSGGGDTGYLYTSQVQEIWAQAGIQVTFLPTVTWNNTEAQRLTQAERDSLYGNTFSAGTGDPTPALPSDAAQIFFVMDHPGTGYDGSANSGWVGNPLANPATMARNAGNAQLGIPGFTTNFRSVMANEGFVTDSLSVTLAHEIGHLLGLRHVNDPDTPQPGEVIALNTTPNLMWAGGEGPSYDSGLSLQENFELTAAQISAAISNGESFGVLQPIPEPSAAVLVAISFLGLSLRRVRTS